MKRISYFYSAENESEINLEIWKMFMNQSEAEREIHFDYTGIVFDIQLGEVGKVDLPERIQMLIDKNGMEALPILVVDDAVYNYGEFSVIDAVEELLDVGVSIQVEED
ncbi:arsenic metallochaperone ArsD family protein [Listeria monocytogenes]|uniref:Arsenic metallochaperone ArsD family protein n=1 Tax=Listeria monocytogenes TaxID=1639 RepID=A0AAN3CF62_LISMN|nr:arsenic metallochaperone ArsD family protein [Listeria monocytogenes]EAA0416818.1 arsenical resistance operon transcriptional repressor ArsD [Listeria monocytogenes]EAC4838498.1 arsenic metallochaperone ArsD family protein [Listeria monocytogenes]EAC7307146.1 arsenic metallochaperone ArsD family protein [Listeria monocytogenes]EAD2639236.1 arsenical resistance operon transcriptional repressor ArsD [Listeria monocytogenes]EAE6913366.1 arsenic metallochaperone ArsD family protein [Listeria mo